METVEPSVAGEKEGDEAASDVPLLWNSLRNLLVNEALLGLESWLVTLSLKRLY
jgi:hypothetical protein